MKKVTFFIFSILTFIVINQSIAFAEASAAGTYYVVQAGYYKNKAIMEKDFKVMAGEGLPVYKVGFKGGYRIYVGDYTKKSEAQNVAEKVKEIGFDALVRTERYAVKEVHESEPITSKEVRTQGEEKTSKQLEKEPTPDVLQSNTSSEVSPNIPKNPRHPVDHKGDVRARDIEKVQHSSNIDEKELRNKMLILFFVMILAIVITGTVATIKRNGQR